MTRRVVKPHKGYTEVDDVADFSVSPPSLYSERGYYIDCGGEVKVRECPYGQPGDRLWVRETWRVRGGEEYEYQQHRPSVMYRADMVDFEQYGWRPSIFMPRWASRITLEITNIRVERLQSITAMDAVSEGIERSNAVGVRDRAIEEVTMFRDLWNSINAKPKPVKGKDGTISHYVSYPFEDVRETKTYRGKPWYVTGDPWVWVVEFRRVNGPSSPC